MALGDVGRAHRVMSRGSDQSPSLLRHRHGRSSWTECPDEPVQIRLQELGREWRSLTDADRTRGGTGARRVHVSTLVATTGSCGSVVAGPLHQFHGAAA